MTETLGVILLAGLLLLIVAGIVRRARVEAIVYPWEAALLYSDGAFVRALPPGRHRFIDVDRRIRVARLSSVDQHVRFGQMDVVTADQFAFRLHLALDAVLADTAGVAADIAARLVDAVPHIEIVALRLVKIDLPPETRRMLTEAERARREGQAALERARAEQASLRALANAARLVKDNPELAQLRLLRTIEDAKGPTTIVMGDPHAGSPGSL